VPLETAPSRRLATALALLALLLAAFGRAAAARGLVADGPSPAPPVEGPAERRLAAEAAQGEAAPVELRPLGRVERLWLRLSGGNPIFALDWLARGGEPEPGRTPPVLPLP
jgi:hypothetical protein